MKVILVTPAPAQIHTGNRTTADRWARLLRELGHQVAVQQDWNGEACDLLIALHARRSFASIQRFREKRPQAPLLLALTGTDVYRDLDKGAEARRSVEVATKIVVLQELAIEAIPESSRAKARVIYQSAEGPESSLPREKSCFQVCVLAHLRTVKDPLRAAYAARELPASSRIVVKHAGAVLDPEFQEQVQAEQRANPRYRWLGPLSHSEAMNLLARSHVLVLTSHLEGGANVVSEAIAINVPVISSRIPGSLGILGKVYPGYFPAGDTLALRGLLQRAESDEKFYRDIQQQVAALRPLVSSAREREAWAALLAELS